MRSPPQQDLQARYAEQISYQSSPCSFSVLVAITEPANLVTRCVAKRRQLAQKWTGKSLLHSKPLLISRDVTARTASGGKPTLELSAASPRTVGFASQMPLPPPFITFLIDR